MNDESADHTVRIRFRIPGRDRLAVKSASIELIPANQNPVTLSAAVDQETIEESDWLVLKSSGWRSTEEAETGSEYLLDVLRRALARHNLGADFGNRAPHSGFFNVFLRQMSDKAGRPVLNDVHGVMVFETTSDPMFANAGQISAFRSIQEDRWRQTLIEVLDRRPKLTERERIAFDLFSKAHAVSDSAEARFVLLFAAIETLLESVERPDSSLALIEQMMAITKTSQIDKNERDSILGSLKWLRCHSIRRNGREFVQSRLEGHEYDGRTAADLFLACYDLRNRLLHGQLPFPTWKEVSGIVGSLEQMVSHLLSDARVVGPSVERQISDDGEEQTT